jgi:hypothetical protein
MFFLCLELNYFFVFQVYMACTFQQVGAVSTQILFLCWYVVQIPVKMSNLKFSYFESSRVNSARRVYVGGGGKGGGLQQTTKCFFKEC